MTNHICCHFCWIWLYNHRVISILEGSPSWLASLIWVDYKIFLILVFSIWHKYTKTDSLQKLFILGLGSWLSSWEHLLLSQRTVVWSPAPTPQPSAPISGGPKPSFDLGRSWTWLCTHMCTQNTHTSKMINTSILKIFAFKNIFRLKKKQTKIRLYRSLSKSTCEHLSKHKRGKVEGMKDTPERWENLVVAHKSLRGPAASNLLGFVQNCELTEARLRSRLAYTLEEGIHSGGLLTAFRIIRRSTHMTERF